MLPKAFQEELVFWYYDTYAEHAEEERSKDEALALMGKEKACELLWECFNTDRLPVPLRHSLRALYEQRKALHVPGVEEAELKEAIKKQEEVVDKLRETYQ